MMNDPIRVSIVMPAYNAEKTIGKSIESVLRQTYPFFELIVVNDCSSDGTVDLVNQYISQDNRVRLWCNDINSGVSVSRNRGVSDARYDWIAFLDSDDCWTENKLELQIEQLVKHPECVLFFTGTAYMDEDGYLFDYVLRVPHSVTYRDILKQNVVSCSSVLVKRSALIEYPMPNNRMLHEDLATWIGILKKYQVAVGIDKPLLTYRISRTVR